MKKIVLLFFSLFILLAGAAHAGQAPTERVKEGLDKVLAVLTDPDRPDRGQKALSPETLGKLKNIAKDYFDFTELTMRSVGQPWLEMTDTQRTELEEAFTNLLERTYLQKAAEYNGETVEYVNEMIKGDRAFVLTNVNYQDKAIPVNYRMINRNQWMIYDVIIEGVSLVKNYRTQFSKVLQKESPEHLTSLLRQKAKEIDENKESGTEPMTVEGTDNS